MNLIWISTCISIAILTLMLIKKKELLFVPTFLFSIFWLVRIQVPALLEHDRITSLLSNQLPFILCAYIAPLVLLITSGLVFNKSAKKAYIKIIDGNALRENKGVIVHSDKFWIFLLTLLAVYLNAVPVDRTGLYAFVTDPASVSEARENSIKVGVGIIPVYAFILIQGALVPVLFACSMLKYYSKSIGQKLSKLRFYPAVIILIFISLLPATRAGFSYIVLFLIYLLILINNFKINIVKFLIGAILVLAMPILYVIRSNSEIFSLENLIFFWEYGVYDRFFITPSIVGVWWINYAIDFGYIGLGGVPKLAWIFNVESQDIANLIGLHYIKNAFQSISAGTNQFFAYFNYFGYSGIIISVLAYLFIDLIVMHAYRFVKPEFMPVAGSCVFLTMVHSTETEVIPLLVTHGLLPSFGLILLVQKKLKLF